MLGTALRASANHELQAPEIMITYEFVHIETFMTLVCGSNY
jgi:hypothetical protein